MISSINVDHEGEFVILSGPEGGKIARIEGEEAIKIGLAIMDEASKALEKSGRLKCEE